MPETAVPPQRTEAQDAWGRRPVSPKPKPRQKPPSKKRAMEAAARAQQQAIDDHHLALKVGWYRANAPQSRFRPGLCPDCNGNGHEGAGLLEDDYPCRTCLGVGDTLSVESPVQRTPMEVEL